MKKQSEDVGETTRILFLEGDNKVDHHVFCLFVFLLDECLQHCLYNVDGK